MPQFEIDVVAGFIALVSVTFFIGKHIRKKLIERENRFIYLEKSVSNISKNLTTLIATTAKIEAETRVNGGSSLKDSSARQERVLEQIATKVNYMDQKIKVSLDESAQGIFECDAEGLCTYVNRTYTRTLNKTPEESYGNGWINNVHPEDREKVFESWRMAVENKIEFKDEYRMITSSGNVLNVSGSSKLIRDGSQNVVGYLGTITFLK